MALSFPLSLPTSIGRDSFTMRLQESVAVLRSPWTFATQIQEHTGQLWLLEASIPPCKRAQAAPWIAFIKALRGPVGTFLAGDPWAKAPQGLATGSPKVNGGSQTGQTLLTKGWTPSVTGILKADDYIQIGQRLYSVTQDANSDGSGNATLEICPRIRESPADNTTIITTNTVGLFRLNTSEVPLYELDVDRLYSVSFTAVEAI